MSVTGQIGSGLPVRKGQLVLPTECERDGAKFSNPSRAATHISKHPKPRIRSLEGGKTRGNQSIPDTLVCLPSCLDRGAYWASTPCLCDCHFVGLTARQMIKLTEGNDAD